MAASIRSQAAKQLKTLLPHTKELDFLRLNSVEQIYFFKQVQQHAPSMELNSNISKIHPTWQHLITKSYPDYITQQSEISGNSSYAPPAASLEVELLWRIHCLNPQTYYSDCVNSFGKIIEKPLLFESAIDTHSEQTTADKNLNSNQGFKVMFNTFESEFSVLNQNINDNSHTIENGGDDQFAPSMNLWDGMHRQTKFIVKILQLTNNGDDSSMIIHDYETQMQCLNRYLKYMYMIYLQKNSLLLAWKRSDWLNENEIREIKNDLKEYNMSDDVINDFLYNNKLVLVPAIDIDLYWHSHCLNPISYHKFSKMLLNKDIINHNDNINIDTQFNANKINNQIKTIVTGTNDAKHKTFDILKYDRICTERAFEYLYDESFKFNAFTTNKDDSSSAKDSSLYAAGCCVGIGGTGARSMEPIGEDHVSLGSIVDPYAYNYDDVNYNSNYNYANDAVAQLQTQSQNEPSSSTDGINEKNASNTTGENVDDGWDSVQPDDSQGFFASFFDSDGGDAGCGSCGGD